MQQKNRNLGILGVGLGEALIAINFSIISVALATIQKEFHASFLQIQWVLNIFGIFICVSLVLMGRLADIYGRKRIFIIALVGSSCASLIAGFAPALEWIIFAQFIQGVVGSILLGVSQALMSHLFPENQKSHAIGIWAAIGGITLGLGPLLGGAIIDSIGWRWIFFINVPIAIMALFIVWRYIEESKDPHISKKFDFLGCILLILTIGFLVLAIVQGPTWGWISAPSLFSFAIFAISFPIFIYVESVSPNPIIHPTFFLNSAFLLPSLANFCLIFFLWPIFFLLPLYFQQARDYSPFITGLLMLLVTGPVALFSHTVGKWYTAVGPRMLMAIGFGFLILSIFLQFFFQPSTTLFLEVVASLSFGIGWVLAWGPSTTSAISSLPHNLAGIASGAFTTIQEVGGTIGLTITGTVFRSAAVPFMDGYRYSLWILLFVMALGLLSSLFTKKSVTSV